MAPGARGRGARDAGPAAPARARPLAAAPPAAGAPATPAATWSPPRPLVQGALLLFGALALLLFDPRLFEGGDNVVYDLLAKALATGHGYVTIYEPGEPPHTLYPPGYPLLLVPTFWLFGGSLLAAQALSLFSAFVSLGLAARYLARRMDPRVARAGAFAAALLLLAINPTLIAHSHWTLTEAPFLAVSLAALLLAESESVRARVWIGAACLAAAGYLIRTAALPLCVAVPWAIWRTRGRSAGLVSAAICLAAFLGWEVRNHLVAPGQPGYLSQFLMVDAYYPEKGTLTLASFLARVANNAGVYAFLEVPRLLWPFVPSLGAPAPPLAVLLGALLVPLALFGFVRQVRTRGVRAGEVYVFLYAGLLLVWQWQGERFLLPITPLVLAYLTTGAAELRRAFASREGEASTALPHERRSRAGPALLIGLLLVPPLVFASRSIPPQLEVTRQHLAGNSLAGYDWTVRDYFASAVWVAENSPPDAVVVSRKPQFTYLFSGRKSVLYPYGPPEEIEAAVRAAGASYLIYDQLGSSAQVYLAPYLIAYADAYEVVHQEGDPPTLVLRRLAP